MVFTIIFSLFACVPEIKSVEEERFIENPAFDYDQDGYTENQGDCDDRNPTVNPAEQEVCDGFDNDCNGVVDDNPEDIQTYYRDADGDGFGSETESELMCPADKSDGYIEEKVRDGQVVFDCDDSDPEMNPDELEICDDLDNNCDGRTDELDGLRINRWYPDADEDGFGVYLNEASVFYSCREIDEYSQNFLDCDDTNSTVFPNAEETCDGIDNNCDSVVDEGTAVDSVLWIEDADADGYGTTFVSRRSCEQPTGFVDEDQGGDCNDADEAIHPNAIEECNSADDDCDGLIDEGADTTAPIGSMTFYVDTDGDGFGDTNTASVQCTVPSGYVNNNSDCDDTNSMAYPNAAESCNGIDDDCDGNTDEEDSIDKLEWFEDADSDGVGNGGSSQFACNVPVGFVGQAGDCDDSDGTILPTATEVCDGSDNNCDGLVDDADANVDLNTATEFFQDADFDGYGNPLQSTYSCLQIPGFVTNSDDCDDANLLRNPVGYEYCNNIDDDCDGVVDDLALDSTDYFVDADGDGHGALVDSSTGFDLNSCPTFDAITNQAINPTGYAPSNDDCDDGDAAISPSASELCTNGIDENCDGHKTAGATDVSTFLVDADGDSFGSGLLDSDGALAYALDLCTQPFGYVPYSVNDSLDCDDGDSDVKPGATELCNGQLDNCALDGSTTIPSDEWDDDGDGRVECTLDVDPLQWADLSAGIVGGDDCDDNDVFAYPDAPELCNGAFEDCNDPLYIAQSQSAPDDEIDDDGDCFVECYGFDANIWEGGVHSCEHVDGIGQIVQETVVIGGEDCNDDNAYTYVGAAYNDPTVCAQDADGDGDADCNLVGLVGLTTNYSCDFGVDMPNGGMGPDFVLIQGGLEPLGRYTLTNDFYVMTTEVTQAMWTDVMATSGYGYSPNWSVSNGRGDLYPAYNVSWYDAIAFANALSVLTGREECYGNTDDPDVDFEQLYAPDDLDAQFPTPYDCTGFRLLTDAEWEYAARSGTTSEFWTGQGSALGGTYSSNTNNGTETIVDGVSNPLLRDYAWYAGNRNNQYGGGGSKEVGQKRPNGFGLYDVHGNLREWTADWLGCSFPPTSTDPYCDSIGSARVGRGGYWDYDPSGMQASRRAYDSPSSRSRAFGFRLVLPL